MYQKKVFFMGWTRQPNKSTRNLVTVVDGKLYVGFTRVHRDSKLPEYKTNINVEPVICRLDWDEKANWFSMSAADRDIDLTLTYR